MNKDSNPRAGMGAKEYLNQAYRIDQRINSKLEQVGNLRAQATKATSAFRDTPVSHSRNVHSMESTIAKLLDLEAQIDADIDRLIALKREIMTVIGAVRNPEYQTLLELRYLCYKTWEQIAVAMCYSVQNIYKLHDKATRCVEVIRKE